MARSEHGESEKRLLSRFRVVGSGVILLCILVYISGEIFMLPFLREGFHVDPTILGILTGTFLILIGVEALNRLPGIGTEPQPPKPNVPRGPTAKPNTITKPAKSPVRRG